MEKAVLIELQPTGIKMTTERLMGGAFHKKIDEVSDTLRFDEDFYENQSISDEKFNECIKILNNYKALASAKGVAKIYAYASPMFQEVRNSKKFFDDIFKKTNIFFNVLGVEEEIRLIYNAVIGTIDTVKGVILYVNPHNTYVMNFAKRSLMTTFTLPFGSNSLAHKFKCEENADASKISAQMIDYVKSEIRKAGVAFEELFDEVRFVGAGSLFLSLAKLARKMTRYPLEVANNYHLSTDAINKGFDLLVSQGFNRSKRLANISAERLDNLIAGVSIIKAFTEDKQVESYNIASRGVTDSLVGGKIVRESTCDGTPSDLLDVSLKNVRFYYPIDESNADNVYNLTFELFQQLSIVHKLTRKHLKALKVATYLYDCGKRVNFENHSLYSRDIILNSDLLNISHRDLIIAAVSCQLQNLDNFSLSNWISYKGIVDEDDLAAARKIGGLISLASALDRGKQNKIKEISCDLLGDIVIIKAKTDEDASYEIAEANKLNSTFKKVFNKTYQIM